MKEIGKVVSAHGVEGDLVISHFITNLKAISRLTELMIEVWENSFIPFFIESVKGQSHNDMIIKFEEIGSREEAKKFLNKKVYVFESELVQTHSEEEWAYLSGFTIFDQDGSNIGFISNILTNGMQVLIEMSYSGKIVHLPLHQDLIKEINKENKSLHLQIAEGLLDM